jgi:HAD superfamily hydrolase (TIGR01509 family)
MAWEKYREEVPLKEGVKEFLSYLRQNNIPAGIATSNSRELVDLVIDSHNMKGYFSSIRTSCEVAKGKPSPDIYLLVAEDLGVAPQKCLVFEDVLQGVMAGKNADMKVCAVYDEYSEKDMEEKKRLSDYYVNTINEVLELLQ